MGTFDRSLFPTFKLNGRQGFAFPETFRSPSRPGGLGRVEVLFNPIGDTRLDNLWIADLRVEKAFSIGRIKLSGMMDIFNLANSNLVLGRERRQNLTTANRVQDILSPRVIRFGVRYSCFARKRPQKDPALPGS